MIKRGSFIVFGKLGINMDHYIDSQLNDYLEEHKIDEKNIINIIEKEIEGNYYITFYYLKKK